MNLKNWERKIAIAQVTKAFQGYGLSVETSKDVSLCGDLIARWVRNDKNYLIYLTPRITREDTQKEAFIKTIEHCKANNLKMVVVAWHVDNRLFDYMMDLESDDTPLNFKLIDSQRLESLNQEWKLILEKQEESA